MRLVNTLKKKKAQITMFIILGIIIVALFGFVYYIYRQSAERNIEAQARQVYSRISEQAFSFYVETCLNQILEQGLETIGNQGGYFYENQSGFLFSEDYYIPRNSDNIAYLIYQDSYPDYYPCRPTDEAPDFCRFPLTTTSLFLGTSQMPTLTQLKRQLEKYVTEEISKPNSCADPEWLTQNYTEFKGYEFGINKSAIKADIRFLANAVKVKLDYPIMLTIGNTEPIMEFLYFTAGTDIRFLKIHNTLVKFIIESDLRKLDFRATEINLRQQVTDIFKLGNVDIEISQESQDDVFIITDYDSKTSENREYLFQFARKNRPPVLDYIHQHEHPQNHPDYYDYLVIEGEQINLSPSIIIEDPDEDTYVSSIPQFLPSAVGKHNIIINATDMHGLSDSQKVRILIDNKLRPELYTFYTDYPGFEGYVSIEDPIYLNASALINSLDTYATHEFLWRFKIGFGRIKEELTIQPIIKIPQNPDITKIKTQLFPYYQRENKDLPTPLARQLELNSTRKYPNYNYSESYTKFINLTQCIPYRSEYEPYPFNNLQNHFLGTHACCNDNFTVANTNTVCHVEPTGAKYCVDKIWWTNKSETTYCNGKRGNICNGTFAVLNIPVSTGLCGNCPGVDNKCVNKKPFSRIDNGQCVGEIGCEEFCKDRRLVVTTINKASVNYNGVFVCGCKQEHEGYSCDTDFDGIFEGECEEKQCIKK